MSDAQPTPRQVLYALVAGGFLIVTAVLTIGAAAAGISPPWWTLTMSAGLVGSSAWTAFNWRKTAPVLLLAIGLLLTWAIGTLIVA